MPYTEDALKEIQKAMENPGNFWWGYAGTINSPHQSPRDAAVCRAVETGKVISNGRPQFFIPDLGE